MDDIEDKLKALPLAAPPESLDRRLEATFASAAARAGRRRPAQSVWWWLAATASLGAAAALLVVLPRRAMVAAEDSAVVYHFDAHGLVREMLLNPNPRKAEQPPFDIQVQNP